jgi:hypothetical protein
VDHTAKILIEGASASMRKKLQAHRTFLEVCWLAWRHDGRVDFAELLRAEGKPVNHQTLGQLRVALTTLNKRHFKGALVMHEDYCELHARLSYRFGANATSDALLDPQQPSADEPAPQLRRRTAKTNGNRSRVPLPESTDDPD